MKRIVHSIASIAALPVSIVWWLGQLVRHLSVLRGAEVVILDPHMVNYGGGLNAIDIARRIFQGRRVVYSHPWHPTGTQNLQIEHIWTDITVLPLRQANMLFSAFGKNVRLPFLEHSVPVLNFFSRIFMSLVARKVTVKRRSKMFSEIPIPPELKDVIPSDYSERKRERLYFEILRRSLRNDYPAPPPVFPERERTEIHALLKAARGDKPARLCMMYNKMEPMESLSPREGSEVTAYLPAIRLLVADGYQVMLAGDRTLDDRDFESFDGMVVDAERLGVDRQLFLMFAPLEADISVGDAGAGMILPEILGIPMLVLNGYPIADVGGVASAWVYPKHHTDKITGEHVPIEYVFRNEPYGHLDPLVNKSDLSQPHPNTEEEITEAVRCFLEEVAHPTGDKPGRDLISLLPRESAFRVTGARLSPAFVKHDHLINSRK
jgi:putative glycosyltransferase (TIGR04372 family)